MSCSGRSWQYRVRVRQPLVVPGYARDARTGIGVGEHGHVDDERVHIEEKRDVGSTEQPRAAVKMGLGEQDTSELDGSRESRRTRNLDVFVQGGSDSWSSASSSSKTPRRGRDPPCLRTQDTDMKSTSIDTPALSRLHLATCLPMIDDHDSPSLRPRVVRS